MGVQPINMKRQHSTEIKRKLYKCSYMAINVKITQNQKHKKQKTFTFLRNGTLFMPTNEIKGHRSQQRD